MYADINNWIKSYINCSQMKSATNKHNAPLQSMPVAEPWEHVAYDVVVPFLSTPLEKKYTVVFQDTITA